MKEKTARLFALLSALCLLFLAACAGAEEAERTRAQEQEALLKSAESYTKVVNILGKNYLYFAQNSPEWTQLFSQEGRKNNLRFGDSGCAIAAFANATVNVLPMERLSEIAGVMQSPVYVDTFCLARRYGKDEDRFLIDSDLMREEYLGFHPCLNTATLRLRREDLTGVFLQKLKRDYTVVELPDERAESH